MALSEHAARGKDGIYRDLPFFTKVKFQHRHFAMIAGAIARAVLSQSDRAHIADSFVQTLRLTNPNFDAARFRAACDVGPGDES